ncbi:succinate dehydrogenase, cytochrome b556 subunit [Cupriavidus sp. TA19]|uniref:succinate dehydrogenase n=1 Tax=Cupriavidus sp. TA19 TaxID=701108 RepID=UPI0027294A9C|nr:succinate dehydrogenase [Cupriavidus sp. TA19]GLC94305.1 succinate dehydrogenase, cytochrome b556 subunit [Cupriavidus sp. TA19]
MKSPRNHRAYWAFLGHRLSGLALGIFLPAHFYVLGLALDENARMDAFLKFADMGAVKVGEWGLVLLLSIHMCFGVRLLALELLPWSSTRDARLSWISWGGALSLFVGVIFTLGVI